MEKVQLFDDSLRNLNSNYNTVNVVNKTAVTTLLSNDNDDTGLRHQNNSNNQTQKTDNAQMRAELHNETGGIIEHFGQEDSFRIVSSFD